MFAIETKQCTKCKQYLDLSNFYEYKRGYYYTYCKPCKIKYQRNRNVNKGNLIAWVDRVIANSKYRAKSNKLEHNITKEWLLANLPKVCPVLGIELSFSGDIQNSPSIDRFDNGKGYTTDNCRIISYRANMLKSNATVEELKAVIKYMKQQ